MARPLNWTLKILFLCFFSAQQDQTRSREHEREHKVFASCSVANDYLIEKLLWKYLFCTSNVSWWQLDTVISWLWNQFAKIFRSIKLVQVLIPLDTLCSSSSLPPREEKELFCLQKIRPRKHNCSHSGKEVKKKRIFQPKRFKITNSMAGALRLRVWERENANRNGSSDLHISFGK